MKFSTWNVESILTLNNDMVSSVHLSRIVLMVRGSEGVASAVNFYHKAIGLQVLRVTDDWAELATTTTTAAGSKYGAAVLTVQSVVANEAQLSAAYSPWLTFTVEKMDETVAACVQAGAQLDGPIQYPAHGTVALLRSPDNHMIGLYEPNKYAAAATSRQPLQSTTSGKR
jgi:predicted enzyme related to lactoylglutathione lyase